MSAIVGNPELPFNTDGVVDTQQFSINGVTLVLGDTSSVDIRPAVVELSLFEDIFSPASSGYVIITDASGWIENANINGFCRIEIQFSKAGIDDPNAFSRLFRVYKIGERFQMTRQKEEYAIYFCSEEMVLNEQLKIARSYPNTQINQIIYNILINDISIPQSKIGYSFISRLGTLEDTQGYYNFIVPNLKPFEAFNWLATYAQPSNPQTPGADMLFYENRYGFNFRSLQSIMNSPVYNVYNYSPKNITGVSTSTSLSGIISYRFTNTFDSLKVISTGGYANKLVTLDPILRQTKVTEFSYGGKQSQTPYAGSLLNLFGTNSLAQNRFGQTVSDTTNAVFKVAMNNKNQTNSLSVASTNNGLDTVNPTIEADVYIPNRTAQMSLINQIKIEFTVPGDPGLSVGRVVTLNLPSYSYDGNPNSSNLDKYFTGNYIISAVRHTMDKEGIYHCIVEAISDSLALPTISASVNSSLTQALSEE